MDLKTFTAPTMMECLAKVKHSLGSDAVILHTRSYVVRRWLGLRRRESVEITAGRGLTGRAPRGPMFPRGPGPGTNTFVPRPRSPGPGGGIALYESSAAVGGLGLGGARRPIETPLDFGPGSHGAMTPASASTAGRSGGAPGTATAVASPAAAPGRQLLGRPEVGEIIGKVVVNDIAELKKAVAELVDTVRKDRHPNVPEDLFDYYMKLVQNQVAEELAGEIVQALRKQVRPEHLSNRQFVTDKLAEHMEKLIPTAGPLTRRKASGPHVVALIGPTGVGKTTTIAKLAANLKLRERKAVGLITLDTYRIAAIEQLRKYADILGARLLVVTSAEELREAVRSLSDCEFVLIDTAGRSPRDEMKINELRTMLAAANPDEVHLVISATVGQACVDLAMEKFGEVKFDRVIFTKLDEAASVGVVLNVITRVNKALSYVTTGQDVPDDIEVGRGRKLAELILNGTTSGSA